MGKILYIGGKTNPLYTLSFTNLRSLKKVNKIDFTGTTLEVDQMIAEVITPTLTVPLATKCVFEEDGAIDSVFYFKEAKKISAKIWRATMESAMGIWDKQQHIGGLYEVSTSSFASVMAQIVGGTVGAASQGLTPITGSFTPIYIDSVLAVQPVTGYLPIASRRENIQQLLFAFNAALKKTSNGDILFTYIYNETALAIPTSQTYAEGSIEEVSHATKVELTEHTYFISDNDEEVTLFDGAVEGSATNAFVVFQDAPIHDLTATGLTINQSGVNYAVVTGGGKLTGKKYTHSTKQVTRTQSGPEEQIVKVSAATLVNPLNSANVADRLMAYYGNYKIVNATFVGSQNVTCGKKISFRNAFNEQTEGYITNLTANISGIDKANCKVVTNYTPTGNGNNYNTAKLLTSGNWTIPSGVREIRAILIGGGDGGKGGYDGTDAGRTVYNEYSTDLHPIIEQIGAPGQGGNGGAPGEHSGKVLSVDITVTPGSAVTISYGQGGAGGARNGGAGGSGTATTLTVGGHTYTSASGSYTNGIINLFNGEVYARPGEAGVRGGNGYGLTGTPPYDIETVPPENITYKGTTYYGDLGNYSYSDSMMPYFMLVGRTGGSGGAVAGRNAAVPDDYNGGDAPTPVAPTAPSIGCSGNGGNGGGGGGSNRYEWETFPQTGESYLLGGNPGHGSQGSVGSAGGAGAVLIYYKQ